MKRFHVHTHVANLAQSIAFYSKLFGAAPTRVEPDYAKWMLDDPRVNFAISARGGHLGVDHLGIQTDTAEELVELKQRARAADMVLADDGETTCCYARSQKHWITDPQGVPWEHFHTLADIPVFREAAAGAASACCTPQAAEGAAPDAAGSDAACCTPTTRGKPVAVPVRAQSSCC